MLTQTKDGHGMVKVGSNLWRYLVQAPGSSRDTQNTLAGGRSEIRSQTEAALGWNQFHLWVDPRHSPETPKPEGTEQVF